MQHELLDGIDRLIDPDNLSRLAGRPVKSIVTRGLVADFAKSGSQLYIVETDDRYGPRFVLKRVDIERDWLMRATEDVHCRSVSLWAHGLFDRLPARIEHGVLGCAREGSGYAILMRDLGEALLVNRRLTVEQNRIFLDAMAEMHATFLDDPELSNPELALCELRHVYEMFSPRTGVREVGGVDEVPKRIVEGWQMVRSIVAPDVVELVEALLEDSTPLCRALSRYPHTLVHGDFRHSNQGLLYGAPAVSDSVSPAASASPAHVEPRIVLLDWQLATNGPPAVELGRYLGANSALLPGSKEETLEYYEQRLRHYLGARFDDHWWRPQLELGLLGGFVEDGWAVALKATNWHVGADAREHWLQDLTWWSDRARAGAQRL